MSPTSPTLPNTWKSLPEGAYQEDDGTWWMRVTTRSAPEGIDIRIYSRDEFVHQIFPANFVKGDHISVFGPTQAGKTTLCLQLVDVISEPKFPAVIMVMKRRDRTITNFLKASKFRLIRDWPPPFDVLAFVGLRERARGYVLWPNHDFSVDGGYQRTKVRQWRIFQKLFYWAYQHGKILIFADELKGLDDVLGLEEELEMIYTQGSSNDDSLMGGTQRPYDVTLYAYSAAKHLLFAFDPDKRDRDRFSQIGGGIDPQLIDAVVTRLPDYWWLDVQRRGRRLCIVAP